MYNDAPGGMQVAPDAAMTSRSSASPWERLQAVLLALTPNDTITADQVLFLDMRDAVCRDILRDSPYDHHPWEPDEQQVMRRIVRRGEIAFDIGAHFGEHSVLLADLVGPHGRVFAFEPNPERLDAL